MHGILNLRIAPVGLDELTQPPVEEGEALHLKHYGAGLMSAAGSHTD